LILLPLGSGQTKSVKAGKNRASNKLSNENELTDFAPAAEGWSKQNQQFLFF